MQQLRLLTVFRFFAATWVLLFHLESVFAPPLPEPLLSLARNGMYAMSFFFVLSGVVLTYGYHDLRPTVPDLRQFYVARVARIFPVFLVVQLIGIASLPIEPGDWSRLGYVVAAGMLGVQAWFLNTNIGINTGTWSVSCEVFFYALFPALLLAGRTVETRVSLLRAAVYLSLFIGFLGLADFAFPRASPMMVPYAYISPLIRLPEFLLGMVIGLAIRNHGHSVRIRGWMVGVAAAITVLASANPVYRVGMCTRANLVIVPLIAALLFLAAAWELSVRRRLGGWWFGVGEYLGRASYCIFLGHLPFIFWLAPAARDGNRAVIWLAHHPLLAFIGGAVAMIGVGVLAHELIEKPARRWVLLRLGAGAGAQSGRLVTQAS